MLESKVYRLKITCTTPLLGSQPGNDTVAAEFMRGKVLEEIEKIKAKDVQMAKDVVESVDAEILPEFEDELQKGTTGFYRNGKGEVILKSYQFKGLFKEAAGNLNGSHGVKNLKSKVNNALYVGPREIVMHGDFDSRKLGYLERPLRGMTAQGPRTSLARSEVLPEGSWCEIEVKVLELPKIKIPEALMEEIFEYSQMIGLLQWRNSGCYGQFEIEHLKG